MSPAILFLGESLLLMALSVPLILKRVKPNPFYGLRTPKSLANPDIWYHANQLSGRALFAAGAFSGVFSLGILTLGSGLPHPVQLWLLLGAMLLSVISATVYSLHALSKM